MMRTNLLPGDKIQILQNIFKIGRLSRDFFCITSHNKSFMTSFPRKLLKLNEKVLHQRKVKKELFR